jgi:hypothetical protein
MSSRAADLGFFCDSRTLNPVLHSLDTRHHVRRCSPVIDYLWPREHRTTLVELLGPLDQFGPDQLDQGTGACRKSPCSSGDCDGARGIRDPVGTGGDLWERALSGSVMKIRNPL